MSVVANDAATTRPTPKTRDLARAIRTYAKPSFLLPLLALGVVTFAAPAQAIVTEPDGRQVPQPLTEDITPGVVSCCGVAADGSNISLDALFRFRGESIHWQNDAATEPSYFSPLCGFKGTMILRGGGCKIDFGWYNVDLNNPVPPPDSEVYPLVSRAEIDAMFATGVYGVPDRDMAFHPHVGEAEIPGQLIDNLRSDARYRGGLIGLATLGNDTRVPLTCVQTHYSEARLNQLSVYPTDMYPGGAPWIMAVVWKSTVTPNAFYIGFEDLPTDPDNFAKLTPDGYYNDGDFNDFVYFVEGITCEGGGLPCLTTAEGACGFGLTECLPDGTVVCVSQVQPGPELCDNLDNDCNGLVDDGDLCPPGEVCDKGVCRPNCSGGEFPCASPLVCDGTTGLCVDQACLEVTCQPGQVCIGGICVGGCGDTIVCPPGQVCQLGRCVDPCYGRYPGQPNACTGGMVCEGGVCVESCHCRVCGPGLECDYNTGRCEPIGCIGVLCPEGQVCQGGMCVNACTNVNCPGGAECVNGWCGDPLPGHIPQIPDAGTGGGTGTGGTGSIIIGEDGAVAVVDGGGPPPKICADTCATANNGQCEDGSFPAVSAACPYGTDCADCGERDEGVCSNTCPTAFNGQCDPGCDPGTDCLDCGAYVPPTTSGTSGSGSGDGLTPQEPGCNCRAVGGSSKALAVPALILLALGLGRLRRYRRQRAG